MRIKSSCLDVRVRPGDFGAALPALCVGLTLAAWAAPAQAQSIEPRAYSPSPVGINFLVIGGTDSTGGLAVDPALPLTDVHLKVKNLFMGYARSIDLWGRSAKIDLILPYGRLSGSAFYQGMPVERKVDGFLDPALRLSVILHGAPVLSPAEFRHYRQNLVIGASVQVTAPVGQYDKTRLLNLGTNRWSVKPEIGMSKRLGRWIMELTGSATFFSTNPDFFGGRKRSQDSIFTAQTNVIYNLPSGAWLAVAAAYLTGGKTSLDGISDRNLQRNWRVGLTAAMPLSRKFSVKFSASKGVSARTNNNVDQLGLALQYRWGKGF
jgi:hypothetical protein